MTDYQYGKRYEVGADQTAAELIHDMTHGRLGAQTLRLWDENGRPGMVQLESVDTARNLVTFRWSWEGRTGISEYPGSRISAVALVNTEPPLDRTDEVRG